MKSLRKLEQRLDHQEHCFLKSWKLKRKMLIRKNKQRRNIAHSARIPKAKIKDCMNVSNVENIIMKGVFQGTMYYSVVTLKMMG